MADLLLAIVLIAFVVVDVALRRIPWAVILVAYLLVVGGHYGLGLYPWSAWGWLGSCWLPLVLFFVAGFPGGDTKAMPIFGAMLGWPGAAWMTLGVLAVTWLLMRTVGRRWSLVGTPWMPFVAIVIIVVRLSAT